MIIPDMLVFHYFVQTGTAGPSYDGLRWTHKREAGPPPLLPLLLSSTCCVPYYLRTQVFPVQPVRFFRTLQDLGDLVKRDWRGLMEQLYGSLDQQPTCSGLLDSLDRCYHESVVQALCRWFALSNQTAAVMEELNTFTACLTHSDMSQSLATSRNSTIKLTG
ncbi:unnamed protein product [Oncorhynchus mykiss]|uniref:Uncharacterized protein n=1 Tax=Oncorhynchus mykiss TaxID=8022 RepID=A0A060XG49_ONCMY|nr:unnamed protein product [Oncorhynchus mykiss]